ncbi:MAG: DnaD domain protein [Lachnospiraceae bacterium]
MASFILKNRFSDNNVIVESEFIDQYMAKANGEYVKVYLLLLRHLGQPGCSISISGMADALENTEKDILRALKYWEREGLLSLEYDECGTVCGLEVGKLNSRPIPEPAKKNAPPSAASGANIKTFESRKELRQILFVAEQYLGKTLTKTEVDTISFFFTDLGFSVDLTEYLIEYCVENGHKSIHYIKSVALAWADKNITTVAQAKQAANVYSKEYYAVMNAFGIKGRGFTPAELDYLKCWFGKYGFSLDIIVEACNRTILNTHQPNFKYAEKILSEWLAEGVKHKKDIAVLDQKHEQSRQQKQAAKPAPSAAKSKFHNFDERHYDNMEELERKLLSN